MTTAKPRSPRCPSSRKLARMSAQWHRARETANAQLSVSLASSHLSEWAGVRFFLTSLGKPDKIVRYAEKHGVKVYHDVHTPEIARRVADCGVDGLNCLNNASARTDALGPFSRFEPAPPSVLKGQRMVEWMDA